MPKLMPKPRPNPRSNRGPTTPADLTAGSTPPARDPTAAAAKRNPAEEGTIGQKDIEALLDHAEAALASVHEEAPALPQGVTRFSLQEFPGEPASTEAATLDLMQEVQLKVRIELGRTHMHLDDVLRLKKGSVVPLDKLAGDPVDIYVNGRLVAQGEVLVLNDNFCVRVTQLMVGETATG